MSDLSAYIGNKFCRWLNNDSPMPTPPTGLFIALYNGNPKTTGTEVTTTVRTAGRVQCPFTTLALGADHTMSSSAAVDFGAAAGPTTLTHLAMFDAASAGNLIASKALVGGALPVVAGAGIKFLAGGITFNVGSDS